jgi:glyoxylate/hydroxypyruvate reductase A
MSTLVISIGQGMHAADWLPRFREALPHHTVLLPDEVSDPAAVHYAVTWKHPPGSLTRYPNLRLLLSLGAGVDHLLSDPALPDVPVVRVIDPDLTARMGEYVVLHCLRILRQLDRYQAQQRERLWKDDRLQPSARQVRVGILGLGELGSHAALLLRALGFTVSGWARGVKQVEDVACFAGEGTLPAFLARTDILVALLPLTPDTRGILDRELFRQLARDGVLGGPHLINAARGGLQNEADILAALDDGTLASATLDVFETEPLPKDSPLWTHPKVLVTPHNAAMSAPEAVAVFLAEQVRRLEAGRTLEGLVDRQRGY